jgi:hypothetical protein
VVTILGAAVIIALVFLWTANQIHIANKHRQLEELTTGLQRVREAAEKVKELEAKEASIAVKDKAIKEMTSDRIVWSEQLYYLARLLPEQVWLKDIEVETKSRTIMVDVPDAKEGEPKTKPKVIPYQSLKLTGYALSYEEEIGVNYVGVLVRAIEDDEQFTSIFTSPEPQVVKEEEFGDVRVKEFEVNCEIVTSKDKKDTTQR